MIERHFQKGDAASWALYSPSMGYRYALTRVWDARAKRVLFIMLNPSTATEYQNDPTVERCERRARALGFGSFRVCNIFAWRETNPRAMQCASAPVGEKNDAVIIEACKWADKIICAWGGHGAHLARGAEVEAMLRGAGYELWCFGLTKAAHPKHPLYISYHVRPLRWLAGQKTLCVGGMGA